LHATCKRHRLKKPTCEHASYQRRQTTNRFFWGPNPTSTSDQDVTTLMCFTRHPADPTGSSRKSLAGSTRAYRFAWCSRPCAPATPGRHEYHTRPSACASRNYGETCVNELALQSWPASGLWTTLWRIRFHAGGGLCRTGWCDLVFACRARECPRCVWGGRHRAGDAGNGPCSRRVVARHMQARRDDCSRTSFTNRDRTAAERCITGIVDVGVHQQTRIEVFFDSGK